MAKDLKGDESIAKEKEFVNREENDRNPIAKDLKGETDESTVEKEHKVLNKKDRSPIAKDLKGEESSVAKEKEVVNREETDRNPIAKDLKGDTDESAVDKEDKVLDEKDRSPVAKDLQGEESNVANKKEVTKVKEVVNSQQEKDRSPIAKDLEGEESSIANEKEVTKVKEVVNSQQENDRSPIAKDLKGEESSVANENEVTKVKEVVKSQQENDRSPIAKDLKGDSESSVEKEDKIITNEKEKEVITSEPKEEDVDDAGVTERFVNFLGGKIRTPNPNPTDVMNSDNNILTLHEICRLYLGINRDTAAVFSSYCNFKAYYHKFQSTGSSDMQFSVSHVDEGDDITIYLKTPGHFYSIPDKHVENSEETGDGVVKTKSKSKAEKKAKSKKKKASKHNKRVNLENFDSETLRALGKRLAKHKTGYKFSNKYNREYFWDREWEDIVVKSLDLSLESTKNLVPFNETVAEVNDSSVTEEYSDKEK